MFEEYFKNKIDEIKNKDTKELIEEMYKNGNLPECEYEKYISQLEDKGDENNDI